jgi:hypothetical protein
MFLKIMLLVSLVRIHQSYKVSTLTQRTLQGNDRSCRFAILHHESNKRGDATFITHEPSNGFSNVSRLLCQKDSE